MEKYNNITIKELIRKYPEVNEILESYKVHCLRCKGNCLVKDVVEAENLSMDEEIQMMTKIAQVVSR